MPPGVISLLLVLGPFAWALWLHRRLKAQDRALQAAIEHSREADRRADASALQFSALSESLPQALWVVGPDGSTRHMNRRWADYTGLSDDECQGDGWLKTVHAEDQQRYLAARDVALSEGTECSIEVRLRRHDGVFRWWLVRVVPARNAAGQIVEWIGSCTDIDDLKQAEDSARRSEDRYRQILETTNDVVLLIDHSDRILYVNGAVRTVFGHAPEALLGQPLAQLQPERLRAAHAAGVKRYLQSGIRRIDWHATQAVGLHREGREFPVEIAFEELKIGGEPLFTAFIRDITERRKAEQLRDSLETQLRESQKMEAIGTLAGGVAHDFNNMLGVILGNLQLSIEQAGPDVALRSSLEEIEKASSRARALVRQILTFSRHQPAERRLCELQPIVEESVRLLRSTLPAQVRIELRGAADLPRVLADPLQIEQVLLNLCTNAAYAMDGGGGLIDLQLDTVQLEAKGDPDRPGLPPGRYLRLRCTDNGCGMDAQTLQRIFEPFFTTKPVGIGTGLGLSVVHGILAAHDGAITARSEPGRGSCFTVYLPVVATTADAEKSAPGGNGQLALPPAGDGSRVLYVDDEEALVFLVRRLLERRGYAVSVFTDPEAAMAAFRAAPDAFDVVVTDFNMPKLSGLDVARIVRELRPDVPIAIASGYVTEELRGQAGPAGVATLIYKEDLVDRFCDSIEQMIRSRAPAH